MAKKTSSKLKKVVDNTAKPVIQSPTSDSPTTLETKTMTLTLKGLNKRGNTAFYSGAAVTLRISTAAFPSKQAPQTIEVAEGIFATARQPKAKLSAEERKALRANQPKPTLAEKIAKREAQLERLRKQAAAGEAGGQSAQAGM